MAFPASRIVAVASGTVMDPDGWFNTMQDGVIGLCVGTNSFKGLILDGTGGAVVAATARQLEATGGALLLRSSSGTQILGGSLTVPAGTVQATNGSKVVTLGSSTGLTTNDTTMTPTAGSMAERSIKASSTVVGSVIYAALQTTNATGTELYSFSVASGTSVLIRTSTVARKSDGSEMAVYEETDGYRYSGGAVLAVTGNPSVQTTFEDDGTWGGQLWTISGTSVRLMVTGKAATTINWMTRIEVIQSG